MNTDTKPKLQALMVKIFALGAPEDSLKLVKADGSTWDSLRHVELLFAVEDEFQISFEEADFANIRTFSDLASRIDALRQRRGQA